MKEKKLISAGMLALVDVLITPAALAYSEMTEELGLKGHSFVDLLANGGSRSRSFIYSLRDFRSYRISK